MLDKVLIATANAHKFNEIYSVLRGSVQRLESIKPTDPEVLEDGLTFLQNAKIKAYAYFNMYSMPTLADDSGLCVKYLNDEPGIFSARYASTNEERIDKLLYSLRDAKNESDRVAYFNTTLVLALTDSYYVSVEGRVYGRILTHVRGDNGFGYDPVFLPDGYKKTYAEMSFEEKNKISHRSLALENLKLILSTIYNK